MPVSVTSACTASGSVFSQVANSTAASTFFDCDVTAVDEPPQLPLATSAPHFGSGAAFHCPAVSAALPLSTPGPHTAPSQPTCVPSFRRRVPLGGVHRLVVDDALLDQAAPVVGDLLGGLLVDADAPGVALDRPPLGLGLLREAGEPAGVVRRERAEELRRVGGVQRTGGLRRTRPTWSAR